MEPIEEQLEFDQARDKTAALSIQKACRGYLARLRARLIRRAKDNENSDPNSDGKSKGNSSYLNSKGDFHSVQWMRKLSQQADRSQAYQLQELERFNKINSGQGRSVLKMGNSRSECSYHQSC